MSKNEKEFDSEIYTNVQQSDSNESNPIGSTSSSIATNQMQTQNEDNMSTNPLDSNITPPKKKLVTHSPNALSEIQYFYGINLMPHLSSVDSQMTEESDKSSISLESAKELTKECAEESHEFDSTLSSSESKPSTPLSLKQSAMLSKVSPKPKLKPLVLTPQYIQPFLSPSLMGSTEFDVMEAIDVMGVMAQHYEKQVTKMITKKFDSFEEKNDKSEPQKQIRNKETVFRIRKDLKQFYDSNISTIHCVSQEDDINLCHALIEGPEGTPYEKGFFYFTVRFPPEYPIDPPSVKFKTTGNRLIRFNPNLYSNGYVCLSILNTWSGPQWQPIMNLTSVLLSIQSILNENPYYNEPGFESYKKTNGLKAMSDDYNKRIKYETLRVAVLDMIEMKNELDVRQMPKPLYDIMTELFRKNYYFYEKLILRCIEHKESPTDPRTDTDSELVFGPQSHSHVETVFLDFKPKLDYYSKLKMELINKSDENKEPSNESIESTPESEASTEPNETLKTPETEKPSQLFDYIKIEDELGTFELPVFKPSTSTSSTTATFLTHLNPDAQFNTQITLRTRHTFNYPLLLKRLKDLKNIFEIKDENESEIKDIEMTDIDSNTTENL